MVIGVKQEAAIKLSQCVLKEETNFAVYLLREQVINLKANEPDLNHAPTKSRDGDQDQVPPQKKPRSVTNRHYLTCADPAQQHHDLLLHLFRQLERER